MDKRSLSISGHRTSIALEPEFWAALEAMVWDFSAATRLAVLRWYQGKVPG